MIQGAINLNSITNYCGKKKCIKGKEYLDTDALYLCYKDKSNIVAFCEGVSMSTYRINISLDAFGITNSKCTCKGNLFGPCKHIAAVLLTWHYKPGKFLSRYKLMSDLKNKEYSDLVGVIDKLIDFCQATPTKYARS